MADSRSLSEIESIPRTSAWEDFSAKGMFLPDRSAKAGRMAA
jgi:hypothetical protein